jgi:hypothetical protein
VGCNLPALRLIQRRDIQESNSHKPLIATRGSRDQQMTEPPDELLAMAARSAAATPATARSSVPRPALTLLNPGMRRKLKVHARMIRRGFMANHFCWNQVHMVEHLRAAGSEETRQ